MVSVSVQTCLIVSFSAAYFPVISVWWDSESDFRLGEFFAVFVSTSTFIVGDPYVDVPVSLSSFSLACKSAPNLIVYNIVAIHLE